MMAGMMMIISTSLCTFGSAPRRSATLVDEVFRIGNVGISQVTIVGIIRNAEKAATSIVYKIDDMTAAPMDARQWVDTDDASSENTVVPPETYVKVAGHLRSFQNKKSLVAFKIMPLEDMNEFTTCILEVVNAHMLLSKSNSQPSAGRAPISNPGMGEAGNFGGSNFIPANGLTVAQNQVNTGVAPDFASGLSTVAGMETHHG